MIVAPKLASVVARQIEDQVVALGWPDGQMLGSEVELLERFGVSRAVLREAVRLVEHSGAARMRRGPGGGLVVSTPNVDAISASIGIWFSYEGVTIGEIFDTRTPLMIEAIERAIDRRSHRLLNEFRDHMNSIERKSLLNEEVFLDLDRRLVALSDNSAVVLFADALSGILRTRLRGTRARLEPSLGHSDAGVYLAAYRRLVDRMAEGDRSAAIAQATRMHAAVRERLVDRPIQKRSVSFRAMDDSSKLASRVARSMAEDIERVGWPVDTIFGSEIELIERYDVSRAIFREAVRILEHDGAVRTKRGPGGGLLVATPDSGAIVRAAGLALEYSGVSARQLVDVRIALEVAAVRLAVSRMTPEAATLLNASIAAEQARAESSEHFYRLHEDIAQASGCRPLSLFVRVMSELIDRHIVPHNQSGDGLREVAAQTHRAHERVVEAIVAGDADLAERRMRRHLNAGIATFR